MGNQDTETQKFVLNEVKDIGQSIQQLTLKPKKNIEKLRKLQNFDQKKTRQQIREKQIEVGPVKPSSKFERYKDREDFNSGHTTSKVKKPDVKLPQIIIDHKNKQEESQPHKKKMVTHNY